jgi:nucleoside-diphosphate-sugar epimerase
MTDAPGPLTKPGFGDPPQAKFLTPFRLAGELLLRCGNGSCRRLDRGDDVNIEIRLRVMKIGRAIVLGSSGFVGRRLIAHLIGAGASEIQAIDIAPPKVRDPGVEYRTHDVREPLPVEWGRGAEVLYNLAAVHRTPGHPDHEYYEANVAGAVNAVTFARDAGIGAMVFTSSISVYGPSETVLVETSQLRPVSAYGRSKRLAERVHEQWVSAEDGRRLTIVRPGVIFGPGEGGNYSQLARALRGNYFFYPGRRDTIKSGGYVDELLKTMDFALSRDERLILYNFAYPGMNTTEEIVRTFAEVAGYRANRATLPLPALLAAAKAFQVANALGGKSWIHPERVMKLVQSTRVAPGWLQANGYEFSTDLKAALTQWRDETDGRFD